MRAVLCLAVLLPTTAIAAPASDATVIKALVGKQIAAFADVDAAKIGEVFTPDAQLIVVDPDWGALAPALAARRIAGAERNKRHRDRAVTVTFARDQQSAVLSFASVLDAPVIEGDYRVSELVVKTSDGWRIAAGLWSEPQANAAVTKYALTGALPKQKPLAPPDAPNDDGLREALLALQTGPFDAATAARPDLIAIGSGPNERTVGGAALARPWAASWVSHWSLFSGVLAVLAPSQTTGWVATDLILDRTKPGGKGTYETVFRVFFVFDRGANGAWSLVHAHFATPVPI